MQVRPLSVLLPILLLAGCILGPNGRLYGRQDETTRTSLLRAAGTGDFPTEGIAVETERTEGTVSLWRVWSLTPQGKKVLCEAVVEDGVVQTLTPTLLNWGDVITRRSAHFAVRKWPDHAVVWNLVVQPGNLKAVVFAGIRRDMDYDEFRRAVADTAKKSRAKYGDDLTRIILWIPLPTRVEIVEEALRHACEITPDFALFPYLPATPGL